MPTTVLGIDKQSKAGCAPERVEKGEDPVIHLFAAEPNPEYGDKCLTIRLSPTEAHALGEALIEDAKAGRNQEMLKSLGGEE